MKHNDYMMELYRGELWECQLLESILKNEGIDCFLVNAARCDYGPLVTSVQQVQLLIPEELQKQGVEVLEVFKENMKR